MNLIGVAICSVSLAVGGCSTTRVITPGVAPGSVQEQLHVGDQARIRLKSGETRKLKITSLDDQTIMGQEGRGSSAGSVQFALADVQSVEYRRVSGLRTLGLVLGAVAIMVTLVRVALESALDDCVFTDSCSH